MKSCSVMLVLSIGVLPAGVAWADDEPAEASSTAAHYADTIAVDQRAESESVGDGAKQPRRGLVIDEIIVTAQKREEAASTVPIAISAYSGDDLASLGITDTRDLRNIVPGFNASDSGYNTPVYTLRGIGFNDSTYSATSTVGIYVDEVNLPYSIMSKGANLDLERVEVLKGPQGTLYGRNTTGGLINYIARKPTDRFESKVVASYGRFQSTDIEASVSGPLTDTLRGRLAVRDLRSQTGWQYSHTRPDDRLGKQDKQSFRGTLEWNPTEELSFRLVTDGWLDKSEPQAPQAVGLKVQQPIVPSTPAFVQQFLGLLPPDLQSLPGLQALIAGNVALAPQVASYPFLSLEEADPRAADWAPHFDWRLNDSFYNVSLRSDWAFADAMTFTGIVSHLEVASKGSQLPQSGLNTLNAERQLNASIKTSAVELRIATQQDAYHWMLGVNASRDDGYEQDITYQETISAAFPDPISGHSITDSVALYGDQDATQLAAFVNGDWSFADTLRLSGGLRYTVERREYVGCSYVVTGAEGPFGVPGLLPAAFSAVPLLGGGVGLVLPGTGHQQPGDLVGDCFAYEAGAGPGLYSDSIEDKNVSGRIALDWRPTDAHLLYASIARGFKSGGYPVLNATQHSQFAPTKQEELLAYELGAKSKMADGRLRINGAAFFYDYTDKQLLTRFKDPLFGALPILRNAPESRVYGFELDLQANPLRGLFVSAAGAYIKTEILEFSSTDIDGEAADFSGKPFNFSPEVTFTVLADYTLPFALAERFDLSLGGDYAYTGKTNSTLENDPRFTHMASHVFGARLRLVPRDANWSVTAFGRNLGNEIVTVSNINVGDAIGRFVGPPRTYGITIDYLF